MKMTCRRIALVIFCLVLAGVAYLGYQYVRAWKLYSAEDKIAHTYFPVVNAIYDYADAHGQPPLRLSDLVPDALPEIPACEFVDSVTFRVGPDGKTWRLELRSTSYGLRRVYCWQSDHKYTAEEEKKIMGQYHGGWTVLKDD